MFKNTRLILNNMNQKAYIKGKGKFKLYNDTGKNLQPLDKFSDEMVRIKELETTIRYKNLKVYRSAMTRLRARQASLLAVPILLGTLTFSAWNAKDYTKTEELPTYKKIIIEMDEENLYRDEADSINYVFTKLPRTYVDGENVARITDTTGSARVNFGVGEKALQVDFTINDDGTWSQNSWDDDSFFNLNGHDGGDAVPIPSKYDGIIEEAANIFKSKVSLRSKTVELVDEILNNSKNDIILTIQKYEYIGDLSYETQHTYLLWRLLLTMCDVAVAYLLIHNRDEINIIQGLESRNGELCKSNVVSLMYAALEYKEALLEAETERIREIDSIAKKNHATGDILSNFERKLIKE